MSLNLSIRSISTRLFLLGCIISVVSFGSLFLIEYSQETYYFNGSIQLFDFLKSTAYCLFIAILEEILFRYLFLKKWIRDKEKTFSKSVIYLGLISSFIFGFMHLNLDEYPLMQINLTFAGMSLFLATYLFRNISLAIGMHFSWNFIQGVIFPFEGSGSGLSSLLLMQNTYSIIPEASSYFIITTIFEVLLIILIYRFTNPQIGQIYNFGETKR